VKVADKAHPDVNDTLRSEGPDGVRARHDRAHAKTNGGTAPALSLDGVHAVFEKWLGAGYDTTTLDATIAAVAAERLAGDPPWLMIISGSGNAKTETISSVSACDGAEVISTITSEGALLSASPRKGRYKGSTGGLLRKIGSRGVLIIKDFTSILSMNREARTAVLAALREICDGRWQRNVGSDGGQTLTWEGRIVVIGACTTAWDQAHSVIASMGDRFVLLRTDSYWGRIAAGTRAIKNTGQETIMRRELSGAVSGLIGTVSKRKYALTEEEETRILAAADVVTLARTGVETDYRGDVIDSHAPEMPTRFAKQLTMLMRGGIAIGMSRTVALALALRCARDSIPQLRLAVLQDVAANPDSPVIDIRRRLQKPRTTTNRTLEALHCLGLVTCREVEERHGKQKIHVGYYSLAGHIDLGALKTGGLPHDP
jgi:hypothetical protein